MDDENHVWPIQSRLPGQRRWYRWEYESALFIVVSNNNDASDSLFYFTSSPPCDSLHHAQSSQRDSVRTWLESAGEHTVWKFVFGHRAYYGAESRVIRPNVYFSQDYAEKLRTGGTSFLRDLEAGSVDFMISGDQHAFTRTGRLKENRLSPDDGVIYLTLGGGGGKIERGLDISLSVGVEEAFDDSYFYTIFKVVADTVRVITVEPGTHRILDNCTVTKSPS